MLFLVNSLCVCVCVRSVCLMKLGLDTLFFKIPFVYILFIF